LKARVKEHTAYICFLAVLYVEKSNRKEVVVSKGEKETKRNDVAGCEKCSEPNDKRDNIELYVQKLGVESNDEFNPIRESVDFSSELHVETLLEEVDDFEDDADSRKASLKSCGNECGRLWSKNNESTLTPFPTELYVATSMAKKGVVPECLIVCTRPRRRRDEYNECSCGHPRTAAARPHVSTRGNAALDGVVLVFAVWIADQFCFCLVRCCDSFVQFLSQSSRRMACRAGRVSSRPPRS